MEKITQKDYNNIHPDFKGIRKDGTSSVMRLVNGETVSVPVEIVDNGLICDLMLKSVRRLNRTKQEKSNLSERIKLNYGQA